MIAALGFSSSLLSAKMRVAAYWFAWTLLALSLAFTGVIILF